MVSLPVSLVYGALLVLLALFLVVRQLRRDIVRIRLENQSLTFARQSQASKYGKLSEQFMPFLDHYPYNPHTFRFLGTPIDGVQFEEDRIVFLEFKTAGSKLSMNQQRIRHLIETGQVEWQEFALREGTS